MKKSSAKMFGELIKNEMEKNPRFYFFSPDETTSNKLDAVYEVTERAWSDLLIKPNDLPESTNGRIVELLSENTLFAVMVGHLLAGEPAVMTSYESFFTIITSQILQHIKFLEQSEKVSWREKYPAVNLLSTSTCWRQDHNGFSHQNPALISTLLSRPGNMVNCFFPVDTESVKATYKYMMSSKNVVNLTTFNKTDEPQWIDENHAKYQFENGASVFGFVSDGDSFNLDSPDNESFDLIFTAAGDIVTRETIAAMELLRKDLPNIRMRFVGINALSYNAIGTVDHRMSQETFDKFFRKDIPIIACFHGYPDTLKNTLANYTNNSRIEAHGFIEEGSTTTPFEMLRRNEASRFDLAIAAAKKLGRFDLVEKYQNTILNYRDHALEFGDDLIEL